MKSLFIPLLALAGSLHAQETPAAKGTPLRLLALGEPPPFRQEVRGDRRVELEADRGALPPHKITAGDCPAVSLSLGQTGAPLNVPAQAAIELKDNGAAIWSTLAVPDALRTKPKLALLWRDAGKSWNTPHSYLLDDGIDVFPSGKIRFVNLLPAQAALKIGEVTQELKPGQVWLCAAPTKEQTLQISFRASDGTWMPVHAATLTTATANTRVQVILYRTDTATARRPAKALVMHEQLAGPTANAAMAAVKTP